MRNLLMALVVLTACSTTKPTEPKPCTEDKPAKAALPPAPPPQPTTPPPCSKLVPWAPKNTPCLEAGTQ